MGETIRKLANATRGSAFASRALFRNPELGGTATAIAFRLQPLRIAPALFGGRALPAREQDGAATDRCAEGLLLVPRDQDPVGPQT